MALRPRLHVHVSTQALPALVHVRPPACAFTHSRFTGPSPWSCTQPLLRQVDTMRCTRLFWLRRPLASSGQPRSSSSFSDARANTTHSPSPSNYCSNGLPLKPVQRSHSALQFPPGVVWPYRSTMCSDSHSLAYPNSHKYTAHSTNKTPAKQARRRSKNGGSRGPPAHLHAHGPCLGEGRHHLRVWQRGEPHRVPRPLFGVGFQPPRRG